MIQNRLRGMSLVFALFPVYADGVELGAQMGVNFLSAPKTTDMTQTTVKKNRKKGFAGRVSLGYVETMGTGLLMGVHGFVGTMGGQVSVHNDQTETSTDKKKTTNAKSNFTVKQGVNTGVYGQLGMAFFGNQRFFGMAGWTLAHFSSSLDEKIKNQLTALTSGSNTKNQWKNGISLGAGYDFGITNNVRVGLTYVATCFPGTLTNTVTLKDAKDKVDQHIQKTFAHHKNALVRRLWNHTVSISASVALNNKQAA